MKDFRGSLVRFVYLAVLVLAMVGWIWALFFLGGLGHWSMRLRPAAA